METAEESHNITVFLVLLYESEIAYYESHSQARQKGNTE